ncbi:MAG: PQQ-dependent sugar dehydrogenase [Thermodesulfobacteriota bacterium]
MDTARILGPIVAVASMLLIGLVAAAAGSQPVEVTGWLLVPDRRPFDAKLVERLRVPAGFRVGVFADDLGNARMMAVASDGSVYLTRPEQNDVLLLRDRDGDGHADEARTVASQLEMVHGIALRNKTVYLADIKRVYAAEVQPDGGLAAPRTIVDELPDGGQHPRRTIGFGPDGRLYVSIGSTCNACREPNEEHAAMLRFNGDGSGRGIFARGLRNTIGFAWHPQSGELWGLDHGSDWRGNDVPAEELNRITQGADYGWPYCHGDRQPDELLSLDPPGTTKQAYCKTTEPPVLTYGAHSAPIALAFYASGPFPPEYAGDAFVAMRGSWNRNPATGFEVARIDFEGERPVRIVPFLTGFLIDGGKATFGRPAGVAVTRDGALLVSDDANGVVYRVAYTGPPAAAAGR